MMRDGLRGFLRRMAVVVALLGLVVAAAVAFGQSNRYPRGAVGGLPNVGTPGTYTFASGGTITIDAQGRVSAISTVTRTIATSTPIAGGGTLAADRTISCPTCVTTGRAVNATAPLGGGGNLGADLTLTCATCVTNNGTTLTSGRVAISNSGTTLKDDDSLAWSATGPTVTLKGLLKPYRIAGGNGSPPTAAPGAGAVLGTSPSCTVTGTDMNGYLTLTTGTSPTAMVANSFNTLCTITYNLAYSGGARSVIVHPGNPAAAALAGGTAPVIAYVDPTTTLTTSFPVRIVSPGTPTLPASTALIYSFVVIQ